MKALQQLEILHAALAAMDHPNAPQLARELTAAIDELRPYFAPADWLDESAPSASQHFKAWSAILDVLREVRPGWSNDRSQTPRANAIAAIRSMAAQCSAQPAPAAPIAWPEPVTPEQMDALVFANGFMRGHGFDLASDQIAAVIGWLRKNGCTQIR